MAKAKKTEQEKVADQMNAAAVEDIETEDTSKAVTEINTDENLPDEWKGFGEWEDASSTIWRPEPGWALMGVYVDRSEFTDGEFDAVCCVHRVKDFQSKTMISFVGGSMLDKFIREAPIGPGTKVFIQKLDQSITKKEKRVNNWKIKYDPSSAVEGYSPDIDSKILEG